MNPKIQARKSIERAANEIISERHCQDDFTLFFEQADIQTLRRYASIAYVIRFFPQELISKIRQTTTSP